MRRQLPQVVLVVVWYVSSLNGGSGRTHLGSGGYVTLSASDSMERSLLSGKGHLELAGEVDE
jgi:hypothetical protein